MEAYPESEQEFTEIRIPVPWGVIAGRWYGDQQTRPILALHGWQDNCGTFARLAPLLAPHISLLCVDLPGHGLSSHLPAGIMYHNLEYVRAILRIMQTYRWERVSLMGHSMGGSVAFHFASFYPDRVDLLIGIDIVKTFHLGPQLLPTMLGHIVERALVDNERLVDQTSLSEPPSYTFAQCERLLYEGSQQSVALEHCHHILERNVQKSPRYPNKYFFARDGRVKYMGEFNPDGPLADAMARRICKKPIPYLVVKGGASTNISARSAEVIATLTEHNPLFEMHEIPGGTHHLHLNDPEPVARLVIAFLRRHRVPEASPIQTAAKL